MKAIYATLISILVYFSTSAQIQQPNNGRLDELVFFVGTNTITYDDQAEGSRYLNEGFTPAKINGIKETQFVRFNAVEGTIEIKDKDKILTLSQSYDYTIELRDGSDRTYETYSFINEDGETGTSFFEKIYISKQFEIFLKERIIYTLPKKAKSSYEQDVPGKFIKGKSIFYVTDLTHKSDLLFEIPKKKKNRPILFNEKSKSIEKFIKKEGLKLTKKEDIITVLNFYFRK